MKYPPAHENETFASESRATILVSQSRFPFTYGRTRIQVRPLNDSPIGVCRSGKKRLHNQSKPIRWVKDLVSRTTITIDRFPRSSF